MEAKYRKRALITKFAGLFTLLISFVVTVIPVKAYKWHSVGNSRDLNISGMALVEDNAERTVFLIVHDNKKKKERRAGTIRINAGQTPVYVPVDWSGDKPPVDLEALTAIPDRPHNFLALTSAGDVYHLEFDPAVNSIRVIRSFAIPSIPVGSNFEGVAFQKISGTSLIVWGDRGEDLKPGTLFWSRFDLETYTFGEIGSAFIKVPYPNSNVRHISDLKVDAEGRIFISSAADPGDDGPFASAVYTAGQLVLENSSRIGWQQAPALPQVFSIADRKIEAFEIVPGEKQKLAFGTDDENLGAAIYLDEPQ
jgi:hypothetical protein